jgi:hypothetical protein
MSASLISLAPELVCMIVKELPIENARDLLALFGKTLSLATNLQLLSLIVNGDKLLSPKTVRRITKRIRSKTLESLTIDRIFTSKGQLEGILRPFRASIKKLTLKSATFNNTSFVGFISHIQENFSLDYICFKDIWEDDNGKEYEVLDRVKLYKEDMPDGLCTLKSDILSSSFIQSLIKS